MFKMVDGKMRQVTPQSTPRSSQPAPLMPQGNHSNSIITRRNGGVQHQFINDIGGCSANYK